MPGPPPKPTKLRLLEGNPSKRPINRGEPQPDGGRVYCPRHIRGEARREWHRVAPELRALGLLTRIDHASLEAYCMCYARWWQAEGALQRHGLTYVTPSGQIKPRPEVTMANNALKLMKAFLIEFGLTPASRSRLSIDKPEAEDPFAAFLRESGQLKAEHG